MRGLNKGSRNIQDGISLVQTTEGALSEVTDMLQRIREASIKAYNDTNTRQDRDAIQAEIEHLKSEIGRVAESTTYNDIHVLQGNPWVDEKYMVSPAYEIKDVQTKTVNLSVPEWIEIDSYMEVHDCGSAEQDIDDPSCYMETRKWGENVEGNTVVTEYKYYGKQNEEMDTKATSYGFNSNDCYMGNWDPSLSSDEGGSGGNASVRIDFGNLLNDNYVGSPIELYSNLSNLLGVSIGCPTATGGTSSLVGISFYGEIPGVRIDTDSILSGEPQNIGVTRIDLTEVKISSEDGTETKIFDAVKKLIKEFPDNLAESDVLKESTKKLAGEIVTAIRDASVNAILNNTDFTSIIKGDYGDEYPRFFNRVVSGDDETSLIIYDYRDVDKLEEGSYQPSTVKTDIQYNAKLTTTNIVEIPAHYETRKVQKSIDIVCSGSKRDEIPVNLPDLLQSIDISDYDIAHYNKNITYSYDTFYEKDEDYQKRLDQYETDLRNYERDKKKAQENYKNEMEEYQAKLDEYQVEKQKYEQDLKQYNNEWSAYRQKLEKYESSRSKTIVEWDEIKEETYNDKRTAIKNGEPFTETIEKTRQITIHHRDVQYGQPDGSVEEPTRPTISRPIEPTKPKEPKLTLPPEPLRPIKGKSSVKSPHISYEYKPSNVQEIDDALSKVLAWRSDLGATQNRLESAYRNNQNKAENTDAAESRIRDTDMAEEMVRFAKEGILQQVGQSMLAQANQNRQGILSLLQ